MNTCFDLVVKMQVDLLSPVSEKALEKAVSKMEIGEYWETPVLVLNRIYHYAIGRIFNEPQVRIILTNEDGSPLLITSAKTYQSFYLEAFPIEGKKSLSIKNVEAIQKTIESFRALLFHSIANQ